VVSQSETLKYLYLLFEGDKVLPLDSEYSLTYPHFELMLTGERLPGYVFNTEASVVIYTIGRLLTFVSRHILYPYLVLQSEQGSHSGIFFRSALLRMYCTPSIELTPDNSSTVSSSAAKPKLVTAAL
jgi:hypothetical protein